MKNKNKVCAIVISYNGSDILPITIPKVEQIVDRVIIVDNDSDSQTKKYLFGLNKTKISIIFNSKNLGIAEALNIGVNQANKLGYEWVLTLDQDSIVHEDMIEEMFAIYERFNDEKRKFIGCLAPRILYTDYNESKVNSIKNKHNTLNNYQEKVAVITSGNLIKTEIFGIIGGYNNDLFIDSVDFDFCLKLINNGYKILYCNDAHLLHSLGVEKEILLLSWKFKLHEHSCQRKYYISRNHIYILRRYISKNFIFCMKKNISFIGFIFQSMILEKNRINNYKCIIKGLVDGVHNVYGEKIL